MVFAFKNNIFDVVDTDGVHKSEILRMPIKKRNKKQSVQN